MGNTASFEKMSQRWRAIGNTVSDLIDPRFELLTSRSRDERVTARPTDQNTLKFYIFCLVCLANDLPAEFHNLMITNLDTIMEPYSATSVVSYQCATTFRPVPENSTLTCTCTANEAGDAVSWICNPDILKLSTTCQPSKY